MWLKRTSVAPATGLELVESILSQQPRLFLHDPMFATLVSRQVNEWGDIITCIHVAGVSFEVIEKLDLYMNGYPSPFFCCLSLCLLFMSYSQVANSSCSPSSCSYPGVSPFVAVVARPCRLSFVGASDARRGDAAERLREATCGPGRR